MRTTLRLERTIAIAIVATFLTASVASANARIIVVNGDAAGAGFNNSAPAVPVGGNPGTTVGAQALNVFKKAARIWGTALDSPVDIYIYAQFVPLACNATVSRRSVHACPPPE